MHCSTLKYTTQKHRKLRLISTYLRRAMAVHYFKVQRVAAACVLIYCAINVARVLECPFPPPFPAGPQ